MINLASQIHRKEHIEIFQTMKLKKKGISLIAEDQNIERNRNQHTKHFMPPNYSWIFLFSSRLLHNSIGFKLDTVLWVPI